MRGECPQRRERSTGESPRMSASDKEATPAPCASDPARRVAPTLSTRANSSRSSRAASEILNRDGVKGMTLGERGEPRRPHYHQRCLLLPQEGGSGESPVFCDAIARVDALVDAAAEEPDPPARVRRMLQLWLQLRHRVVTGEESPVALFGDMRTLQKPQRSIVGEAYRRFFAKLCALFESPEFAWMTPTLRAAPAHILSEQILWGVIWLRRYDPMTSAACTRACATSCCMVSLDPVAPGGTCRSRWMRCCPRFNRPLRRKHS